MSNLKHFPGLVPVWTLGLAGLIWVYGSPETKAEEPLPASTTGIDLTFGFTGPEIFPIDNLITHLKHADINGDGLQDLLVVNNLRSKIDILINKSGMDYKRVVPEGALINELPPDSRFQIDSIASEKRITALLVEDINQDQKPDILYYGEPKELVIQYNEGDGNWSTPKRIPILDGHLNPNVLDAGDLNGDGLTDVILLGESNLYALYQDQDHQLREPEKIPYSGVLKAAQILDVDGNNLEDLMLVNWDQANPVRFRLQEARGVLGPEIHFEMAPIRSYWADDLDHDQRTEIMSIALRSGRVQISNFQKASAETLSGSLVEGQLNVLPLNPSDTPNRGFIWGDLSGDGKEELMVAEPNTGQITVYFSDENRSGWGRSRTFPALTGIREMALGDWNQDGQTDLFLLSSEERVVGVTRLDSHGRLLFPEILPIPGRPLSIALGALSPCGSERYLWVISEVERRRVFFLVGPKGVIAELPLNEEFRSNPSSIEIHDLNQDGLQDLVILIQYEKIKMLVQGTDKKFEEIDLSPPGGSVDRPWMSAADVDEDGKEELLLAQRNFVRAVVLRANEGEGVSPDKRWGFEVKEQINGGSSQSQITGATAMKFEKNGKQKTGIFLLDASLKGITFCERDEAGVWQVVRNIPLPVSEFQSIQTVSTGTEQQNILAFFGESIAAWMPLQGEVWKTRELDGYETPIQGGFLRDVVSGDLNQDGIKDLVFLETAENHLDLVAFVPPHRLVPVNRWRVFEARTFRNARNTVPEPREALITDLTGDGKADLAILVHDRILVYPQE